MHTVNGYCELMARTPLTEEQALFVSSIQQACHAINVIAGNVLGSSIHTHPAVSRAHACLRCRFQQGPWASEVVCPLAHLFCLRCVA